MKRLDGKRSDFVRVLGVGIVHGDSGQITKLSDEVEILGDVSSENGAAILVTQRIVSEAGWFSRSSETWQIGLVTPSQHRSKMVNFMPIKLNQKPELSVCISDFTSPSGGEKVKQILLLSESDTIATVTITNGTIKQINNEPRPQQLLRAKVLHLIS